MVSSIDIVALAVVLAKRDVTSVTVPENEICNRPSITPQSGFLQDGLNKFKIIIPATNFDDYGFSQSEKHYIRKQEICNYFCEDGVLRKISSSLFGGCRSSFPPREF